MRRTVVNERPDNDTDSNDRWYYTCYNEKWQKISVFRGSDSDAKERYIYHAAGLDGMGSSSYIDDMVLRDWDKNSGWTSAADSTKEVRHYYLQNWRHDVVAVLTHDGKMVEQVKYLSYGTPIGIPAGDGDCDGDWDANDAAVISGWTTGYDVRYDANLDGVIDADDITYANSIVGGGGYHTIGLGVLSSPAVFNRQGYAGYEHAPELAGTKYHVRHRVLDSELGRWTRRDPLGYVDGMGVYEYGNGKCIGVTDPDGRLALALDCKLDFDDDVCKEQCAQRRSGLGATVWNPDCTVDVCCICLGRIMEHYPNAITPIRKCVERHENVHVRQGCRQKGDSRRCRECPAYIVELDCLREEWRACRTKGCKRHVEKRIDEVWKHIARNCIGCALDQIPRLPRERP